MDSTEISCRDFRLGASQIIAPVSMANINGKQNPATVAHTFVAELVHHASRPTVDALIITTAGLYANNEHMTASQWRNKYLDQSIRFRNQFTQRIAEAANDNSLIIPMAYQLHDWDGLLLTNRHFTALRGKLRQAYNQDTSFQQAVDKDIVRQGRMPAHDTVSFILEEHVMTYALYKEQCDLERRLAPPDSLDQIVFTYPGHLLASQIMAYKILQHTPTAPENQWLYADTSQSPMRVYDVGKLINRSFTPIEPG